MTTWIIPEGITEITKQYIQNNMPDSTTEIVIPESVKSIDSHAFENCTRLESVMIPSTVQSIGYEAFSECTNLEYIEIPESVQSISIDAFYGCTSLNVIILPDELVENKLRCGITDDQTVIPYSQFSDWKRDNGLENKSYSDQAVLFLYQLQNIKNFNPPWNEVLKQCPEVGVLDIMKFSGTKKNCKPAWARLGYQGLSDNRVSGKDLSGFLTAKEAAVLAAVSKIKVISAVFSQLSISVDSLVRRKP